MLGMTRPLRFPGTESRLRSGAGTARSVGFAVKVIGVGIFTGLMLTYCNALLDACMSGIH
jgi:hypothetical protein